MPGKGSPSSGTHDLFSENPFLREAIKEACERDRTNDGLIVKLENRLQQRGCSLALPPVLSCLSDLRQFSELHRASQGFVRKWEKSVKRSYGRDARALRAIKLKMAQLQRKKGTCPEKQAQSLAKLSADAQAMGRPKKIKPGDTIRMTDPVTAYYADIKADVRHSRIRNLLTVDLPGRCLQHTTARQGMVHILAACIKGLVDHGFTAYEGGTKVIPNMVRIFYPTYAQKAMSEAARETYRNQYVRRKLIVVNSS